MDKWITIDDALDGYLKTMYQMDKWITIDDALDGYLQIMYYQSIRWISG